MARPVLAQTRTDELVISARAKLPDDLELAEYVGLVNDLDRIAAAVDRRIEGLSYSRPLNPYGDGVPYRPIYEVRRAQYGSDFLVVISVIGAAGAAAAGVGGAFLAVAKGIRELVAAGSLNEDRLRKKEERLGRREARNVAIRAARDGDQINFLEAEFPLRFQATVHRALGRSIRVSLKPPVRDHPGVDVDTLSAFAELAEYGVILEVDMPEGIEPVELPLDEGPQLPLDERPRRPRNLLLPPNQKRRLGNTGGEPASEV